MAAARKNNTNVGNNSDSEDTEPVEKGKKRLRKIYFTCAAIKRMPKRDADGNIVKEDGKQVTEAQLIMEEVEVPTIRDREQALDIFKKNHGITATNVIGPNYRVRGTASAEKRVTISVPANKCRMSGKVWEGVFQGWKVLAQGIQAFQAEQKNGKVVSFEEDEVVYLFWDGLANENEKLPKPRFGGNPPTILRSAVEDTKLQA